MITLDNISVGYGHRHLISDVCCTLAAGRSVALIGRNGAGKSSLLRVMAGLERPQAGHVLVNNMDINDITPVDRARSIAFVTTERVRIANLRCRDVVGLGRAPYTDWAGRLSETDHRIVIQALADVGMADFADRTMDRMSDGECQRVMIARALAQDTPVMLLDEPTSFLDIPNRRELCTLLRSLAHDRGKCILYSTHELDIALSLCDDILLIDSPRLLTLSTADPQTPSTIDRVFFGD